MVDLETIEALYENVCIIEYLFLHDYKCNRTITNPTFFIFRCQRVQPEELERIKKHYETSEEEDVKLLDKPEQSVSPVQTGCSETAPVICYKCACVFEMERQAPSLYSVFSLCP